MKLSTAFPEWPLVRQTPGSLGVWGNCYFLVDKNVDECDYWVVQEDLCKPERTRCPPENVILITGESPSVRTYEPRFLKQFATVLTCHRNIDHSHVIHAQPPLPWHVGRRIKGDVSVGFSKDYDELCAIRRFKKDKVISLICSDKQITDGHSARLEFVRRLKAHFGSTIDIFGRGICEIEDKWDAIAPYKYHVVLENGSFADYWTEKLADAYLAGAYPFYCGCPNLADYFPRNAFTYIDINDPYKSISVIERTIGNHTYSKSVDVIMRARTLVMNKYNIFSVITDLCKSSKTRLSMRALQLKPQSQCVSLLAKAMIRSQRFIPLVPKPLRQLPLVKRVYHSILKFSK